MAGLFKSIGNILTGGSSGGTQAAAGAADPFSSQRGQYQTMLADLLKDPSSVTKLPGYQFQLTQGLDALSRVEAGKGTFGGGTMGFDAISFGEGLASSSFNQWEQMLAQLSGATIGSPGTAGQLLASGAQQAGGAVGGLMGSLSNLLFSSGNTGGGGGGASLLDFQNMLASSSGESDAIAAALIP